MTCSRITRKCRRVASSRFKRSRKSALKSKWGRRANKRQTFSLSDDFVVFRCLAARLWSREVDETGGCREGASGALCTSLPQVSATTGKARKNAARMSVRYRLQALMPPAPSRRSSLCFPISPTRTPLRFYTTFYTTYIRPPAFFRHGNYRRRRTIEDEQNGSGGRPE